MLLAKLYNVFFGLKDETELFAITALSLFILCSFSKKEKKGKGRVMATKNARSTVSSN